MTIKYIGSQDEIVSLAWFLTEEKVEREVHRVLDPSLPSIYAQKNTEA